MKTVKFEYSWKTVYGIRYNTIEKKIPGWADLTADQAATVATVLYGKYNKTAATAMLVRDLLGIKLKKTPAEEVFYWGEQLQHFFEASSMVHNPFKKIRCSFTGPTYYGPAEKFKNLVFDEFRDAERFYIAYAKGRNVTDLNKFMAVFFRSRKTSKQLNAADFDGDVRIEYNSNTIDSRAHQFSKVPLKIKEGFTMYYLGCKQMIKNGFPELFFGDGTQDKYGLYGLQIDLTGPKWGSLQQVGKQKLATLLVYLDRNLKQSKENV